MSSDSDSISRTISEVLDGRVPLSDETREHYADFYDQAFDRVVRWAYRITRDVEAAQDIAQDAVIEAIHKRHEFEHRSSLLTFVMGIAKYKALNWVRRLHNGDNHDSDGIEMLPQSQGTGGSAPRSVLQELSQRERVALIRRVAQRELEPVDQQVADLRYADDIRHYETIGRLLEPQRSAQQIRADLQRVKRKMAPAIQRELDELGHGSSFFRTRDIL